MNLLEVPIAGALFLLLFVATALSYVRSRSALAGAVVLVFAASAPLFIARLLDVLFGVDVPYPLSIASALGLLAQPLLTLRLVSMLHPVPRIVSTLALAGYLATSAAVVLFDPLPAALIAATVTVYGLTALTAATYLAAAARRRTGSARIRLYIASAGSVLMAGSLMMIGSAAVLPDGSPVVAAIGRFGVLFAAIAYVTAFLAPRWLRRVWQARTGYELSRRLLSASAEADAGITWRRFTELVAKAAGVTGAGVLLGHRDDGARAVAEVGTLQFPQQTMDGATFGALVAHAQGIHQLAVETAPVEIRQLVAGSGAQFVTLVPFAAPRAEEGLLVLAGERRSLFARDDSEMFALLGVEAALLADRARAAAERAELAGQLAQTVDALRSASQAKSDFVASMSHELRTPLNAILGFSDLMLGEPASDGRHSVRAEWIQYVRTAGQHLLALINDVLDVSKVEAGRLELQVEAIDAEAAVAEAVTGVRPLAAKKNLRLSSQVAMLHVRADRGRLRQMLYNLLSNAIKYTPDQGEVRVEASVDGANAYISVVDTGVGIAPEDQARVFEAFAQVGEPGLRQAGTGLGLALTKRLVEAHGGRLELESTVGVGSRFILVLPLSSPTTAPATGAGAAPIATSASVGEAQPVGRPNVLVIEDDQQAVALLREYLEPDGYEITSARDGVEGIAAARRHRPAAILLDVILPGPDGWEVLRRLKADEELRHIPVVMVTVVDEHGIGLALGAVDYLVKPVERGALLAALRRHVRREPALRRPRILAADDDRAALAFVQATLQSQGCDVTVANGGREAIHAAHAGEFDLVICDIVMPDLDGFEVVARLKASERTRDVPILVLTAHELGASDKARLNGKIVGICEKGEHAAMLLRRWLASLPVAARTNAT
ncbi:MAG: response regulator [Chloroflexota bacterium]|nr:response regulator [Chloroflexota bacterium]